MKKLFRYLKGGLVGMLGEYLYRVDSTPWVTTIVSIILVLIVMGIIIDVLELRV